MKKKICFVVAIPATANAFLRGHIDKLSKSYDVYLAGNINSREEILQLNVIEFFHIDINRKLSLFSDLKAVGQLLYYCRKMKFDVVHSVTPKAGLITALAGFMSGTKHRTHIYTGQVWATMEGSKRRFMMFIDRLIALLDNHILVDGKSQMQYLIDNGIFKTGKAQVLANGSICGVDTQRFLPSQEVRKAARNETGVADKIVFVFMGRLNHDKGLYELLSAFNRLAKERDDVFLLLFGNDEENVATSFVNYKNLSSDNFLYYGTTHQPERMLQAGDVFVLPTYREGFGCSVIEAACLGLPTITSDAYGVLDASIDGVTGLCCKVGDVESLFVCLKEMADNENKRQKFGKAGRKRVLQKFSETIVVEHWKAYYDKILSQ